MTKILIKALFLASIVVGGVLFSKQKQLIQDSAPINDLEQKKTQFQGTVKGITDNISNQTQALTTRGKEVSEHVNNVLGMYITPTKDNNSDSNSSNDDSSDSTNDDGPTGKSDQPIYEETLEYGRYLYCQQVVEDYESRQ